MKKIMCPVCNSSIPKLWLIFASNGRVYRCDNCNTKLRKKCYSFLCALLLLIIAFFIKVGIDYYGIFNGLGEKVISIVTFFSASAIIILINYHMTKLVALS